MSVSAVAIVSFGETVTAVSKTVGELFTFFMVRARTSTGMSWGRIAMPPLRAIVSAILRPEIAVMLETTKGMPSESPSFEVRSTSMREGTELRDGIMNTSL